ncbi:MAG: hypothetical protein J07HX5_01926, partial [halophilic archaeon J07HX5]
MPRAPSTAAGETAGVSLAVVAGAVVVLASL